MSKIRDTILNLSPRTDKKPDRVFIEPTSRCNTRCLHCSHYHYRYGEDMEPAVAEKAIHTLLDDLQFIIIQGNGEPLIARPFYDILDTCVREKTKVFFTTNAIKLKNKELLHSLLRTRVTISISVDGACKRAYNFVRPRQKWRDLIKVLEMIKKIRKKEHDCRQARINFICVAMKDTFPGLPALIRMAHKYAVEAVHVQALMGDNNVKKLHGQSPFTTPDITSQTTLESMALAGKLKVDLKLPPAFQDMACLRAEHPEASWPARLSPEAQSLLNQLKQRFIRQNRGSGYKFGLIPCREPWECAYIGSDGNVYACCMKGPSLGNLKNQEWESIWNGPGYRFFRKQIHSWNPPAICRECILSEGIGGGNGCLHTQFFSQFQPIPMDTEEKQIDFSPAFTSQTDNTGNTFWHLQGRTGTMAIRLPRGSRFLRLTIANKDKWDRQYSPGYCRIGDNTEEPFDLSSPLLHFPIEADSEKSEIRFEMKSPGDDSLVIKNLDFLS